MESGIDRSIRISSRRGSLTYSNTTIAATATRAADPSTTPKGAGTSQSTPTATTAFARRAVGYTPQRKRRGRLRDNAPLDAVKRSHRRGGSREHGSQHIVCAAALHFELRRKHHPMSE